MEDPLFLLHAVKSANLSAIIPSSTEALLQIASQLSSIPEDRLEFVSYEESGRVLYGPQEILEMVSDAQFSSHTFI
jgi:hypothetical protein